MRSAQRCGACTAQRPDPSGVAEARASRMETVPPIRQGEAVALSKDERRKTKDERRVGELGKSLGDGGLGSGSEVGDGVLETFRIAVQSAAGDEDVRASSCRAGDRGGADAAVDFEFDLVAAT